MSRSLDRLRGSLRRIAKEVQTPTYVYDGDAIDATALEFQAALSTTGRPTLACYSVKANSNLAVLAKLAKHGIGFDIVSGGELARVLRVGADPLRVVFSGVGKTEDELAAAVEADILQVNVESESELLLLADVARKLKRRARFALRVNPVVNAKTHPYIATALKTSKFGVSFSEARSLYRVAQKSLKSLEAFGIACHIGSQVTSLDPLQQAATKVAQFFKQLRVDGISLSSIDLGGGLGVRYSDEEVPSVDDYVRAVSEPLRGLDAALIVEPGRRLVAKAGVLLTRVVHVKDTDHGRFVIIDAGMNDFMRPALYGAEHEVKAVGSSRARGSLTPVTLVGPVCESSDVFRAQVRLGTVRPGDLLIIRDTGAYGMSMASTYNSRPRPAEVMLEGNRFRVVRARESIHDVWRGETT